MSDIAQHFTKKQRDQLLLIGFFIMEFSQAEFTLRWIIGLRIAKAFHEGVRLIENSDISRLLDGFIGVLDRAGEKAEDIRKAVKDFREINQLRVKIVHGFWSVDPDKLAAWKSSGSNKATQDFEDPKKLEDLALRCENLRERLTEICNREMAAMDAERKKTLESISKTNALLDLLPDKPPSADENPR
jgi:hypothetical protein